MTNGSSKYIPLFSTKVHDFSPKADAIHPSVKIEVFAYPKDTILGIEAPHIPWAKIIIGTGIKKREVEISRFVYELYSNDVDLELFEAYFSPECRRFDQRLAKLASARDKKPVCYALLSCLKAKSRSFIKSDNFIKTAITAYRYYVQALWYIRNGEFEQDIRKMKKDTSPEKLIDELLIMQEQNLTDCVDIAFSREIRDSLVNEERWLSTVVKTIKPSGIDKNVLNDYILDVRETIGNLAGE